MCRYLSFSATIAILLILLVGCVSPIAAPTPPNDHVEPTAEALVVKETAVEEPTDSALGFAYLVRVVDVSERSIAAARILIEIEGQAPLGHFTDSEGYGRVDVPISHAGQPGRIIVEADGYRPFRQEIDLYEEQLPQIVRLEELLTTVVTPETQAGNTPPDLFILTEDDRRSTWFISGPMVANFEMGDFLIVYAEIVPGTEIAIAQLRVIAENPTSLLAQTVLVNPRERVRSGLRVDGNLEMLSSSELVPAEEFAVGYLLEAGRIRLRSNSNVVPGTVIQAYEAQMIGGTVSDYLPFDPPLLMRVTQIGVSGVIASVVLEEGTKWPLAGTLVSDRGVVPTPTATSTATPVPPTATPSPTAVPAQLPTATPAPAACQTPVDPELVRHWAQTEMGCPVNFSSITWASYTPYQSGFMVWRRDTNRVYGFFNNGNWLSVPDVWNGSSQTQSRGEPPPGYREPIRGTGHVWGTDDRFFNGLGWAADDQKGFCAKVQPFEQGFILLSSTVNSCHEGNLFNNAGQGGFGLSFLKAHNSGNWR